MRFSIILPVRNGETALPECIGSVLDQPCRDMEILLVDQGSEDGTAMLCRGYEAAYPDVVRVLRLENGDANAARNEGIRQARGEYLLFTDCSVVLRPEAVACLSRRLEEIQADLYLLGPAGRLCGMMPGKLYALEERPGLLLEPVDVRDVLWKRQLFDDAYLRFPEEPGYEALRLTRKAMALSRSITAVPEQIHLRRTRWPGAKRELAVLDAMDDLLTYFRRRGLLECYGIWLTRLTGLLICEKAREVLTDRKNPVCLGECVRYLENRFPDYRRVTMPRWCGLETEKLLELIRQERWTRLNMLFALKKRGFRKNADTCPG